jgi:hypothetical protein
VAARVLTGLLGPQQPGVDVQAIHIHISDVTHSDPQATLAGEIQ